MKIMGKSVGNLFNELVWVEHRTGRKRNGKDSTVSFSNKRREVVENNVLHVLKGHGA